MRAAARRWTLAALLPLGLAACDKPVAIGESNVVIVAAPDTVWTALRDQLEAALEPRVFTVRNERVFDVTPVDPRSDDWTDFRHVRNVLVIGSAEDPWVEPALQRVRGETPSAPAIAQARNVWAQNQIVTIVLVPPGASPEAVEPLIASAGEVLLEQYTRYSRARMFVSGVDSARADSLERDMGFSLLPPEVYRVEQRAPDVVVFRNDNPDPSQLIREVDVTWRERDESLLDPEAIREWRAELAASVTDPPQVTDEEIAEVRELRVEGERAVEIHGVWSNPPGEWPAAGPYIARVVQCPERTYLLNAWLYAPGRPKYQYVVQLQTLLESFSCIR